MGGTINFCVWHGVFNLSLLIYKVIVSYAFSFSIKCLLSGSCFYPTEFVDIFFFSSVELIAYYIVSYGYAICGIMILSLWVILFQWLDCFLLISCVECNNKFLWIDSSSSFNVFQKAESYLAKVEQQPCMSTKIALSPLMEALVTDQILKHGNCVVKVSAVACVSEITRITAPDAPYDDNQMTVLNMPNQEVFFCFINTQLHAHNL